MHERQARLFGLIEPTVTSLGFELVGVLWRGGRSRGLVRVYIDREEGVTVDDCVRVSHRVNGLLDVEDPVPGKYDLEVSSPGADRPLFVERDFARFAGARLKVTLHTPVAGRRRFTGTLGGYEGGVVLVDEHGVKHRFAIPEIDSARLVPQWQQFPPSSKTPAESPRPGAETTERPRNPDHTTHVQDASGNYCRNGETGPGRYPMKSLARGRMR